jgi:hypothetical protein
LRDLNVRLIGVHGLSFDFTNGSLCITNAGSRPGLSGSWVDPPGRPGLAGFLHLPVFLLTRTGPATGSAGSRVDPPGRSVPGSTRRAGPGLITMVFIF